MEKLLLVMLVKVNLANCCNPVYGDPIIGYITKGNGISVHRLNCHNLESIEDRTLEVVWNSNTNKRYLTCLLIYATDNENHMLDIVQCASIINVGVDEIKTINREDKAVYELNCYVTSVDHLNKLMVALNKNKYIEKVERAIK